MMTDFHIDEIFRVECGTENGTAFLISENLMITAFHVVTDSEQGNEIFLHHIKHGKLTAKINKLTTDDLKNIDIAILVVSKKLTNLNYIKLAISNKFPEGVKWYTRGYIEAKQEDGLNILPRGCNTITSSYDTLTGTRNNYDIDLSVEKEWSSYEGMSGSPLMINGYAYGVITTEIKQGGESKEISALSTRQYLSVIRDLNIDIIDKQISGLKSNIDTSANESYESIIHYDPRTLSEKLINVCKEIRKARIQQYSRSAVNSNIELNDFPKNMVNALKYRIFEAGQKLLLTKIENGMKPNLSVAEIEEILDEYANVATEIIRERTTDYLYPINNKESIKNAVLALIDDCYLAFDEEGLYEED